MNGDRRSSLYMDAFRHPWRNIFAPKGRDETSWPKLLATVMAGGLERRLDYWLDNVGVSKLMGYDRFNLWYCRRNARNIYLRLVLHVLLFWLVDVNIGGSGCKNVFLFWRMYIQWIWFVCLGINMKTKEWLCWHSSNTIFWSDLYIRNRLDIGSSRIWVQTY